MTDAHLASKQRQIAVLRAIAGGATSVKLIMREVTDGSATQIRTALTALRIRGYIRTVIGAYGGYSARYEMTVDLDEALDEMMPKGEIDMTELEQAMGIPESVRRTLASAHRGTVIVGRASINAEAG